MANSKIKKTFKLNVLGLLKWESEEWTVKEVALILVLVMIFILTIVIVLRTYALPALGVPAINKLGAFALKNMK